MLSQYIDELMTATDTISAMRVLANLQNHISIRDMYLFMTLQNILSEKEYVGRQFKEVAKGALTALDSHYPADFPSTLNELSGYMAIPAESDAGAFFLSKLYIPSIPESVYRFPDKEETT